MPVVVGRNSFKLIFKLDIVSILRVFFILITKELRIEVSLIIVGIRLRFLMIDGWRIRCWWGIIIDVNAVDILLDWLSGKR